jgi:aspartyl-tRNA(Asn)/glutamyl-tRNA(Gln) amidotransferase subunit B
MHNPSIDSTTVRIGLEIHCQLTALKSKLFCACSSDYRGKEPNSNVCTICMGLPGTLPLLNKRAVEYAIMIALSLNCSIPERMVFYRKNYFYPDLPKNFQITQYNAYEKASIGSNGYTRLDINGISKVIRIRRIQLEEDPGRLVYEERANYTLVDYNRAGVALVEIVTEPDFNTAEEVRAFLNKLASILEHLGVCDTELEGAVRCDANVSFADGARVEIKNINSFREVERAIDFEITRQRSLVTRGISVVSETRHWDDLRRITVQARSKEEEQDYRYFPEQDIPAIYIRKERIDAIKARLPELPDDIMARFVNTYSLNEYTAKVLVNDKRLARFFEDSLRYYSNARELANWIVSDLKGYIERDGYAILSKVTPKHIAELVALVDSNKINRSTAKQVMRLIVSNGAMPSAIVQSMNLDSLDDRDELRIIINKVIKEEEKAVNDAIHNEKALNYLLGKVMRYTKGRADPKIVFELLKESIVGR